MLGFLIDTDGELLVQNGNLAIGDVTADIAERVIVAYPGEFKEVPVIGGNVKTAQNGQLSPFWTGETKEQLTQMLVEVNSLKITDENIIIDYK